MANWREAILEKLDDYTGFVVDMHETYITVACQNPDSFAVSIYAYGDTFHVYFDGWHEHFNTEEDALHCFVFGLSKECRLKVVKRGQMDCSWTLQSRDGGSWVDDTTTGMILIPFWRPAKVQYRQNTIERKDG